MNQSSDELFTQAMEHAGAGRWDDAAALLRRAVELSPGVMAFQINLGSVLARAGNLSEAIDVLQRAVTLEPGGFEGQANLGNALASSGRFAEAVIAYRRALAIRPGVAPVQRALATALHAIGDGPGAIAGYRDYLKLQPGDAGSWFELGRLLRASGDLDGAVAALNKCIESQPNHADARGHLANLLHERGVALHHAHRWDDAIATYQRAIALKPDYVEAYVSLGAALYRLGEISTAKDAYQRALALRPGDSHALKNLGTALLMQEDYPAGWRAFEARYVIEPIDLKTNKPLWNGEDLHGKRILLVREQGLGDVLQFIRYVPMVQQRGGRVSVTCWNGLKRLLTGQLGIEAVNGEDESPPEFDVYCPLGMLPRIFGTDATSIPAKVPYLNADSSLVASWKSKIEPANSHKSLRVGLVWMGNPRFVNNALRSIPLTDLGALNDAKGVTFFSLQKGAAEGDLARSPIPIVNLSKDIRDLADTAAAIANLDLVITVDTSVAHLAGAMGKQVWVLLQFMPDWRWLLGRSDSVWYSTMRLFRQPRFGDWGTPIREVVKALEGLRKSE